MLNHGLVTNNMVLSCKDIFHRMRNLLMKHEHRLLKRVADKLAKEVQTFDVDHLFEEWMIFLMFYRNLLNTEIEGTSFVGHVYRHIILSLQMSNFTHLPLPYHVPYPPCDDSSTKNKTTNS